MKRRILIIAGPNGAGKTTFARAFVPQEAQLSRFINADLIAVGLSPFEPETATVRAARLMLEEIDGCINRGESFAFETTLAGGAYLRRVAEWRATGWHVTLFFLALPNAEAAIARVAGRVSQGAIYRSKSSAVASRRVGPTPSGFTGMLWTTGCITTTRAPTRCFWTGRTTDERGSIDLGHQPRPRQFIDRVAARGADGS